MHFRLCSELIFDTVAGKKLVPNLVGQGTTPFLWNVIDVLHTLGLEKCLDIDRHACLLTSSETRHSWSGTRGRMFDSEYHISLLMDT